MTRIQLPVRLLTLALGLVVAACSSGPPSPPALAYGPPAIAGVVYDVSDTTSVEVSMMGQSMSISQEGTGSYEVDFEAADSGVSVRLVVGSLDAVLNQPLGAPLRIDEGSVQGELVFTLDARGDATVVRMPTVDDEASQLVSGPSLAHTFFPALPVRPVEPGDVWVDTLSFEGAVGPGSQSESSIVRYTAVGDTTVDGRRLLRVDFEGNTVVASDLQLSGMALEQESELELSGFFHWDVARGVLVERVTRASGSGAVRIPIAPAPLPIRVRTLQRARLRTP